MTNAFKCTHGSTTVHLPSSSASMQTRVCVCVCVCVCVPLNVLSEWSSIK